MKKVLIVENGAGFGGALSSLATYLEALSSGGRSQVSWLHESLNALGEKPCGEEAEDWEVHLITSYEQQVISTGGAVAQVQVLPRERRYGSGTATEQRLRKFFGRRAGNVAFLWDYLTSGRQYANTLAEYIRRHQIDVVHCNNGVLINDAAVRAARKARVPCVVHSRGPEYPSLVGRFFAGQVDHFMPVSNFVAATVHALGMDDADMTVVPEGLDCPAFTLKADPMGFRQDIGVSPDVLLVGMVGCFVGWKGHEVFLEACVDILEQEDAVAVLVGDSPVSSPEQMQVLQAKAEALGIRERVIFTGHRSDVASAMAAFDVVVHASTAPEPFGRVLLEAMAVRSPVVATDAGGPAEVLTHGQDGLLVAPADVAAMARSVVSLLKDATLRKSMGEAGYSTCLKYSMPHHVNLITGVYRKLLAC